MESAQPLRLAPPPHVLRRPLLLQEEKVEKPPAASKPGTTHQLSGWPCLPVTHGTGAPWREEGKSQLRINGTRTRGCILKKGPPQSRSWGILRRRACGIETIAGHSSPPHWSLLWGKWPATRVRPFSSGPPGSSAGVAAHWRKVWVPPLGLGRWRPLTGGQG